MNYVNDVVGLVHVHQLFLRVLLVLFCFAISNLKNNFGVNHHQNTVHVEVDDIKDGILLSFMFEVFKQRIFQDVENLEKENDIKVLGRFLNSDLYAVNGVIKVVVVEAENLQEDKIINLDDDKKASNNERK